MRDLERTIEVPAERPVHRRRTAVIAAAVLALLLLGTASACPASAARGREGAGGPVQLSDARAG